MQDTTIHMIYASTSGNVESVVEHIADLWRATGQAVETHRAEQVDPKILENESHFLFATSTWEHGVLNPFFKKFHEHMATVNCTNKKACFVGCGDLRYEQVLFNEGIKIVKRRWSEQNGQVAGHLLLINGEPFELFDTVIQKWAGETLPEMQHAE